MFGCVIRDNPHTNREIKSREGGEKRVRGEENWGGGWGRLLTVV